MRLPTAACAGLLLAPLGGAAAAPPGEVQIVVLPVHTEGDVADVARQRIESALDDALSTAGVKAVAATGTDSCADVECLQKAAREAGATHALQLRVSATGRDYATELTIADAGGAVSRSSGECAICGFDEVAAVVRDEATTLASKLLQQGLPARLKISSQPGGAVVTIDGKPAGRTPLDIEVAPGPHAIEVEKTGYIVAEQSVTAAEGIEESISVRLRELPVQRDVKLIRGGWASVGVGIGLLAGSGVLWGIHHQPVRSLCTDPEDRDLEGRCRWRYEVLPYAIPMTVLGVAGVVTGVVLISRGKKGGRERERAPQVGVSPTGLVVSGRF